MRAFVCCVCWVSVYVGCMCVLGVCVCLYVVCSYIVCIGCMCVLRVYALGACVCVCWAYMCVCMLCVFGLYVVCVGCMCVLGVCVLCLCVYVHTITGAHALERAYIYAWVCFCTHGPGGESCLDAIEFRHFAASGILCMFYLAVCRRSGMAKLVGRDLGPFLLLLEMLGLLKLLLLLMP